MTCRCQVSRRVRLTASVCRLSMRQGEATPPFLRNPSQLRPGQVSCCLSSLFRHWDRQPRAQSSKLNVLDNKEYFTLCCKKNQPNTIGVCIISFFWSLIGSLPFRILLKICTSAFLRRLRHSDRGGWWRLHISGLRGRGGWSERSALEEKLLWAHRHRESSRGKHQERVRLPRLSSRKCVAVPNNQLSNSLCRFNSQSGCLFLLREDFSALHSFSGVLTETHKYTVYYYKYRKGGCNRRETLYSFPAPELNTNFIIGTQLFWLFQHFLGIFIRW